MNGGPRLLDLFCGAGGASMGYHRAGCDVVGVDITPQPRYPFEFHQADAMTFPLDGFDAIHASPPCQAYASVTDWRGRRASHPDLIADTRDSLNAKGRPWVIENVPEAPILAHYLLCGSMFGLRIRRHRAFETNWTALAMAWPCYHKRDALPFTHKGERAFADAMGCEWLSAREARQAIPPAYTEHIGTQLLDHLRTQTTSAA